MITAKERELLGRAGYWLGGPGQCQCATYCYAARSLVVAPAGQDMGSLTRVVIDSVMDTLVKEFMELIGR